MSRREGLERRRLILQALKRLWGWWNCRERSQRCSYCSVWDQLEGFALELLDKRFTLNDSRMDKVVSAAWRSDVPGFIVERSTSTKYDLEVTLRLLTAAAAAAGS